MSIETQITALTNASNSLFNAVNVTKSSIDTTIATAATKATSTAITAAATVGTYPNGATIVVPVGVTGTTALVGGSGGTDGTFALAFTGGGGSGATGTFTVASGAVTSVTITGPGYGYTSAPLLSFAASAGLTGASVTATIGTLVPSGKFYWATSTDGLSLTLYQNVAGTATLAAPLTSIPTKAGIDTNTAALQPYIPSTLASESGYLFSIKDASSRVAFGIKTDGSVDIKKLSLSSPLSPASISDNSITGTKLTDSSITTIKLNDASVTTSKVVDFGITYSKLNSDVTSRMSSVIPSSMMPVGR
jgi:hypothetical protein